MVGWLAEYHVLTALLILLGRQQAEPVEQGAHFPDDLDEALGVVAELVRQAREQGLLEGEHEHGGLRRGEPRLGTGARQAAEKVTYGFPSRTLDAAAVAVCERTLEQAEQLARVAHQIDVGDQVHPTRRRRLLRLHPLLQQLVLMPVDDIRQPASGGSAHPASSRRQYRSARRALPHCRGCQLIPCCR